MDCNGMASVMLMKRRGLVHVGSRLAAHALHGVVSVDMVLVRRQLDAFLSMITCNTALTSEH